MTTIRKAFSKPPPIMPRASPAHSPASSANTQARSLPKVNSPSDAQDKQKSKEAKTQTLPGGHGSSFPEENFTLLYEGASPSAAEESCRTRTDDQLRLTEFYRRGGAYLMEHRGNGEAHWWCNEQRLMSEMLRVLEFVGSQQSVNALWAEMSLQLQRCQQCVDNYQEAMGALRESFERNYTTESCQLFFEHMKALDNARISIDLSSIGVFYPTLIQTEGQTPFSRHERILSEYEDFRPDSPERAREVLTTTLYEILRYPEVLQSTYIKSLACDALLRIQEGSSIPQNSASDDEDGPSSSSASHPSQQATSERSGGAELAIHFEPGTPERWPGVYALLMNSHPGIRFWAQKTAKQLGPLSIEKVMESERLMKVVEGWMQLMEFDMFSQPPPTLLTVRQMQMLEIKRKTSSFTDPPTKREFWSVFNFFLSLLDADGLVMLVERFSDLTDIVLNHISSPVATLSMDSSGSSSTTPGDGMDANLIVQLCRCCKTLLDGLDYRLWIYTTFTPYKVLNGIIYQCSLASCPELVMKSFLDLIYPFFESVQALEFGTGPGHGDATGHRRRRLNSSIGRGTAGGEESVVFRILSFLFDESGSQRHRSSLIQTISQQTGLKVIARVYETISSHLSEEEPSDITSLVSGATLWTRTVAKLASTRNAHETVVEMASATAISILMTHARQSVMALRSLLFEFGEKVERQRHLVSVSPSPSPRTSPPSTSPASTSQGFLWPTICPGLEYLCGEANPKDLPLRLHAALFESFSVIALAQTSALSYAAMLQRAGEISEVVTSAPQRSKLQYYSSGLVRYRECMGIYLSRLLSENQQKTIRNPLMIPPITASLLPVVVESHSSIQRAIRGLLSLAKDTLPGVGGGSSGAVGWTSVLGQVISSSDEVATAFAQGIYQYITDLRTLPYSQTRLNWSAAFFVLSRLSSVEVNRNSSVVALFGQMLADEEFVPRSERIVNALKAGEQSRMMAKYQVDMYSGSWHFFFLLIDVLSDHLEGVSVHTQPQRKVGKLSVSASLAELGVREEMDSFVVSIVRTMDCLKASLPVFLRSSDPHRPPSSAPRKAEEEEQAPPTDSSAHTESGWLIDFRLVWIQVLVLWARQRLPTSVKVKMEPSSQDLQTSSSQRETSTVVNLEIQRRAIELIVLAFESSPAIRNCSKVRAMVEPLLTIPNEGAANQPTAVHPSLVLKLAPFFPGRVGNLGLSWSDGLLPSSSQTEDSDPIDDISMEAEAPLEPLSSSFELSTQNSMLTSQVLPPTNFASTTSDPHVSIDLTFSDHEDESFFVYDDEDVDVDIEGRDSLKERHASPALTPRHKSLPMSPTIATPSSSAGSHHTAALPASAFTPTGPRKGATKTQQSRISFAKTGQGDQQSAQMILSLPPPPTRPKLSSRKSSSGAASGSHPIGQTFTDFRRSSAFQRNSVSLTKSLRVEEEEEDEEEDEEQIHSAKPRTASKATTGPGTVGKAGTTRALAAAGKAPENYTMDDIKKVWEELQLDPALAEYQREHKQALEKKRSAFAAEKATKKAAESKKAAADTETKSSKPTRKAFVLEPPPSIPVDELHKTCLRWKLPQLLSEEAVMPMKRLPVEFESAKEYVDLWLPLLMDEARSILKKGWEDFKRGHSQCFRLRYSQSQEFDDFSVWSFTLDNESLIGSRGYGRQNKFGAPMSAKETFLKMVTGHDVFMLIPASSTFQLTRTSPDEVVARGPHLLGLLDRDETGNDTIHSASSHFNGGCTIKLKVVRRLAEEFIEDFSLANAVARNAVWTVVKLESLSTLSREFVALNSLAKLPKHIFATIIQPKSVLKHYGMAHVGVAVKEATTKLEAVLALPPESFTEETQAHVLTILNDLNFWDVTLSILQDTGIGIIVNKLKKQKHEKISVLASALIKKWKSLLSTIDVDGKTQDKEDTAEASTIGSSAAVITEDKEGTGKGDQQEDKQESKEDGASPRNRKMILPCPDKISPRLWRKLLKRFNLSQMHAVSQACNLDTLNSGVTLLQGPPGTGKTKTVLGILSALLGALRKTEYIASSSVVAQETIEEDSKAKLGGSSTFSLSSSVSSSIVSDFVKRKQTTKALVPLGGGKGGAGRTGTAKSTGGSKTVSSGKPIRIVPGASLGGSATNDALSSKIMKTSTPKPTLSSVSFQNQSSAGSSGGIPALSRGPGSSKLAKTPRILLCAPSNGAVDELVTRILRDGLYDDAGGRFKPILVRLGRATDEMSEAVRSVTLEAKVATYLQSHPAQAALEAVEKEMEEIRKRLEALSTSSLNPSEDAEEGEVDIDLEDAEALEEIPDESLGNKSGKRKSLKGFNPDMAIKSKKALGARLNKCYGRRRQAIIQLRQAKDHIRKTTLNEASIICSTLSTCGGDSLEGIRHAFDAVIIDEAGQAVEISTLIPLRFSCARLILIGDPRQLPATVISTQSGAFGYDRSLFERLESAGHPLSMLTMQYRMHPEIRAFPSSYFYEDRLTDGPCVVSEAYTKPFHLSSTVSTTSSSSILFAPYRFYDIAHGRESRNSSTTSVRNEAEAEIAIRLCERLFTSFPDEDLEVGIITPYKEQMRDLRRRMHHPSVASLFKRPFRKQTAPNVATSALRQGPHGTMMDGAGVGELKRRVEVNTVDGFQGREKDVIIFSCVRTDMRGAIGFLSDVRRMNVGLTRAKYSLLVLGNADALAKNRDWSSLVQDANRRDCLFRLSESLMMSPCASQSHWQQKSQQRHRTATPPQTPQSFDVASLASSESQALGISQPIRTPSAEKPVISGPLTTPRETSAVMGGGKKDTVDGALQTKRGKSEGMSQDRRRGRGKRQRRSRSRSRDRSNITSAAHSRDSRSYPPGKRSKHVEQADASEGPARGSYHNKDLVQQGAGFRRERGDAMSDGVWDKPTFSSARPHHLPSRNDSSSQISSRNSDTAHSHLGAGSLADRQRPPHKDFGKRLPDRGSDRPTGSREKREAHGLISPSPRGMTKGTRTQGSIQSPIFSNISGPNSSGSRPKGETLTNGGQQHIARSVEGQRDSQDAVPAQSRSNLPGQRHQPRSSSLTFAPKRPPTSSKRLESGSSSHRTSASVSNRHGQHSRSREKSSTTDLDREQQARKARRFEKQPHSKHQRGEPGRGSDGGGFLGSILSGVSELTSSGERAVKKLREKGIFSGSNEW